MAGRETIGISTSRYILTLGSLGSSALYVANTRGSEHASVHDAFLGRCVASSGDTAAICIRDIMSCYMITQTLHISVIKIGIPFYLVPSNLLYVQPTACDKAKHFWIWGRKGQALPSTPSPLAITSTLLRSSYHSRFFLDLPLMRLDGSQKQLRGIKNALVR